ncbi:MAG: AmmeMemoRadiSam system radical SAM enzyme [Candidatus Omnitrophota bacterium]
MAQPFLVLPNGECPVPERSEWYGAINNIPMKNLALPIAILAALLASTQLIAHYSYAQVSDKEAMYYNKLDKRKVQCVLCPRRCIIPDGKRGFCRVRENRKGTLYSLSYGRPVAVHVDPVEKKPLFHVLPGSKSFSIATAGCNLSCKFCQNWEISQVSPEDINAKYVSAQEIVELAKKSGSKTIAYTYTEPTIFFEYALDIAKLAHTLGLKNVMHTAGFINEEPLKEICKYIDAANVDLKGSDKFYEEICLGNRNDVLNTLKVLKEEGVWLEITYLVVPTLNDDQEYVKNTSKWIKENLGPDVPLHISRFWPTYKLNSLSPTPVSTLEQARQTALEAGLKYVYVGNVSGNEAQNTYCPNCKKPVMERVGYTVLSDNIVGGKCKYCGEKIEGVWE